MASSMPSAAINTILARTTSRYANVYVRDLLSMIFISAPQ